MKGLKENEKLVTVEGVTRIGKLVKTFKNTKSKYKYKVRIAPNTFIYLKEF